MKFTREYCTGGLDGKGGDDDFVVGYHGENGSHIKVNYVLGNESYRWYSVGGRCFDKLAQAKAYATGMKI